MAVEIHSGLTDIVRFEFLEQSPRFERVGVGDGDLAGAQSTVVQFLGEF